MNGCTLSCSIVITSAMTGPRGVSTDILRKCFSAMYFRSFGLRLNVEVTTLFFQIHLAFSEVAAAPALIHTRICSSMFANGEWQLQQSGAVIKFSQSSGGKNPFGGMWSLV